MSPQSTTQIIKDRSISKILFGSIKELRTYSGRQFNLELAEVFIDVIGG